MTSSLSVCMYLISIICIWEDADSSQVPVTLHVNNRTMYWRQLVSKSTVVSLLGEEQLSTAIQDKDWIFKSFDIRYPERQGLSLIFLVICSRALSPCLLYQLIQNGCTVLRVLQIHKKFFLTHVKILYFFFLWLCLTDPVWNWSWVPQYKVIFPFSFKRPCSCSHEWSPTITPLPSSSTS